MRKKWVKLYWPQKVKLRKEILEKNNIEFVVQPSNIDEEPVKKVWIKQNASSEIVSKNLAELKANKISMKKFPESLVIGADSVIDLNGKVVSNQKIGKKHCKY